jgi:hypothetical protein
LPDFAIESVVLQPARPADGRPATVSVTVKNRGAAAGNARYLDVWFNRPGATPPVFGDVGDWWGPVGQLAAGESRVFNVPPQLVHGGGTNRLCVFVEFEHLVSETTVTNNHAFLDYPVLRGNGEFDYEGDGPSDIAVFYKGEGKWYIRRSSAPEPFAEVHFGWSEVIPVPADYDGDGRTDIAAYHPGWGKWYTRPSSTGLDREETFGWSATAPVPGDYDGDGRADLAVFHQASGTWYLRCTRWGDQTVRFGWSEVIPAPADYDGDGKTDIAVYHPAWGNWYVRNSSTEQQWEVRFGWDQAVPVPGDYDGDGKADIAVFYRAASEWFVRRSSAPDPLWQFKLGSTATAKPAAADYDGDGTTDPAVYEPATGTWRIRLSSTGATFVKVFGWSESLPVLQSYQLHTWYKLP